ncbi:glutamate racemase [Lactobacillus sp. PV037]|uniref:glutamate racemase n=1 Tax=Lactobacillus sp. PV037 TaxID=2594496 RepID=UPI002240600F|nr:glutamate racemase [Lactobacillus sp. PV037]QNQ84046.1 glutamate racemase [Lactobacillus sp. PV037]
MDKRPIGVLDSGLGGLTVLKKVVDKLPNENTIFIGDQKNMPYGDKSRQEIIDLTRKSVDFLLSKNVKVIIFGCNTATAWAMEEIQKEIPVQIIGVIHSGALAASKTTAENKVVVLATQATVKSEAYTKQLHKRNSQIEVKELSEPRLAPLVEQNPSEEIKKQVVKESLAPLTDIDYDTLILGCTHYPLLKKEIEEVVGENKKIVDPADQVAQYTYNVLKRDELLNNEENAKHEYYTTGDAEKFKEIARVWMDDPTLDADHIED